MSMNEWQSAYLRVVPPQERLQHALRSRDLQATLRVRVRVGATTHLTFMQSYTWEHFYTFSVL